MKKNRETTITHRAIVMPDTHAPLHDRKAVECVLQAIEILKPDRVIHLGDLGEFHSVCHHEWKRKRQPPPEMIAQDIQQDVIAIEHEFLDLLDEACDKGGVMHRDILTGNHDNWLNRFVDINPDYAHVAWGNGKIGYGFDQVFDWKKRGWTVHPCGERFAIGSLRFYHGHLYGGIYHTMNHLRKMGVNIMYGHWHDVQYCSLTHDDGAKGAWCIGTLKRLEPGANEWLAFRSTNWGQAFAIVDWWGNGRFTVHMVNIIDGQCSLLSHHIDGRKPRSIIKWRRG